LHLSKDIEEKVKYGAKQVCVFSQVTFLEGRLIPYIL
jgi:hypothetical protein